MKRIVASVGLVAVGASGLQAAVLPALTTESGKPWNLSATLRGFYDDNVSGYGDDFKGKRDSYGFEISPSLQFSFPWEQTTLNFGYVYSLKYYETKQNDSTEHYDESHEFSASLSHSFSERYSVRVKDSFVVGQEPDMLRAGNTYSSFQRIPGSNLRNYGSIGLSAQMTPELGVDVSYANTLMSYAYNQYAIDPNTGYVDASTSGLSDYMDHLVDIGGRYQLMPQTTGVLGFQFRETDYTGNQPIWYDGSRNQWDWSSSRNARSYYGYAGLDHNFRRDLTASIRAGGRFTDYYNNPAGQDTASPYAMASLQYIYSQGSYIQLGGSYDYSSSATTFRPDSSGNLTLNADALTVFGSVNQRITPKLYGSIMAQFQNSTYYGGLYNNKTDKYYTVGLNLQYRFTPNFSAEVGYNYDKLDSEVSTTFDRNRIYVGVTGSY